MHNLSLRPLELTDAPPLFHIVDRNRPQLKKFWWEQGTVTPADSARFIADVNRLEAENGAPTRGICIDETLLGIAALHTIDWRHRTSQLGYWLDSEQTGNGYGTQVVRCLAVLAFDELDLNQLRISTREANMASLMVAEKAGFQLQGITNEHLWQTEELLIPTATYSLDSADYTIMQNLRQQDATPHLEGSV